MNTAWPMSCQVTYTVTQFFGNVTIGTASLNLAFRVSITDIECSQSSSHARGCRHSLFGEITECLRF
jgi:hypothetical protein